MSWRSGVVLLLALAGCTRQSETPEQASADEVTANAAAPVAAAGAIDRSHRGEAAPAVAFTDMDGRPARLRDFAGKPVLVNLWATWCAPCVAELPALDRAAGQLRVPVIAVSQDLDGAAKVRPFLAAHPAPHVRPYLDARLALSTAYQANLPTTILYDASGREIWRSLGGRRWDSAESLGLIGEAEQGAGAARS
jgi:thiol-disulfide isomerase/thioredoxin